jgi:phosphoribosyl 1,2-cyclic phosphate phosphodiesterase
MGVPVVGCHCDVCKSESSYNHRLRPSALIKIGEHNMLIDASPDFRYQALRAGIDKIDSVIFTHGHHDHTAGVDDLRIFSLRSKQPLPCLLSTETLNDLKTRFHYIFDNVADHDKVTTNLGITLMDGPEGTVNFQRLRIQYVTYKQGNMTVNGLRFGDLAYITDIKEYSSDIFEFLKGVKILVISALRYTPSPLHFSVDEAVEFSEKLGAQKTWLTHIAHELDHDKANAYLPPHVRLGYDGLEFEFQAIEANKNG